VKARKKKASAISKKSVKVSIRTVAEKAGVSPAVVSLVMNGKAREARISENTTNKIIKIASKLNYTPNRFAKGLKDGKSKILGLIVADISNPFFAELTRHIENKAEGFKYKVIFGSSDENAEKMSSIISLMKTYNVDGFIIVPPENSKPQILQLVKDKYPLVIVDRYFPGIKIDNIIINNEETAFKGTEFLIKSGCKNIAIFVYKLRLPHMLDRVKGFKKAVEKSGLEFGDSSVKWIRPKQMESDTLKGIEEILRDKPQTDGIFFATDTLAINSIKALKKFKVNIPDRFKIVSFDENSSFDLLDFPIPHFTQPISEMGKKAVQMIVDRIENNPSRPDDKVVLLSAWTEK
jgi:LacI family transcriptional regulator